MAKDNDKLAGAWVEPRTITIGSGKLLEQMDDALARTFAALVQSVKQDHDTDAKASVTAKVSMRPNKEQPDLIEVAFTVDERRPKAGGMQFGQTTANGRVLVDLGDAPAKLPGAQLTMFTRSGEAMGLLDRNTGEVIE